MGVENAEVDYVDATTGRVLYTLPFYEPGLDGPIPFMSGGVGRPLARSAAPISAPWAAKTM